MVWTSERRPGPSRWRRSGVGFGAAKKKKKLSPQGGGGSVLDVKELPVLSLKGVMTLKLSWGLKAWSVDVKNSLPLEVIRRSLCTSKICPSLGVIRCSLCTSEICPSVLRPQGMVCVHQRSVSCGHKAWSGDVKYLSASWGHKAWSVYVGDLSVSWGHKVCSVYIKDVPVSWGHKAWSVYVKYVSVFWSHKAWSLCTSDVSLEAIRHGLGTSPPQKNKKNSTFLEVIWRARARAHTHAYIYINIHTHSYEQCKLPLCIVIHSWKQATSRTTTCNCYLDLDHGITLIMSNGREVEVGGTGGPEGRLWFGWHDSHTDRGDKRHCRVDRGFSVVTDVPLILSPSLTQETVWARKPSSNKLYSPLPRADVLVLVVLK